MHINKDDKLLLLGLAEGNVRIYDYLFLHYYSGLVAYAIKLGVEKDMAEDIVQDFFLKLWNNRTKLSIRETLKSYFFTSIKNRCLDHFRHQKTVQKVADNIKHDLLQQSSDEGDFLVESELRDHIKRAIDALPEKCQKVFIMNRFKGMKPAEIAEQEGMSVRTVEGHIGKALRILRSELKPYLPAYLISLLLS